MSKALRPSNTLLLFCLVACSCAEVSPRPGHRASRREFLGVAYDAASVCIYRLDAVERLEAELNSLAQKLGLTHRRLEDCPRDATQVKAHILAGLLRAPYRSDGTLNRTQIRWEFPLTDEEVRAFEKLVRGKGMSDDCGLGDSVCLWSSPWQEIYALVFFRKGRVAFEMHVNFGGHTVFCEPSSAGIPRMNLHMHSDAQATFWSFGRDVLSRIEAEGADVDFQPYYLLMSKRLHGIMTQQRRREDKQ